MSWSVVVPTYRRPGPLTRCLEALVALDAPAGDAGHQVPAGDDGYQLPGEAGYQLVVVDDGSEPSVEPVVAAARERAPAGVEVVYRRQANAGPAAARNAGAAAASGTWLAFTDDDCAPRPRWLRGFAAQAARTPDALLGGRTVNAVAGNLWSEASQQLVTYITDYYAAPGRTGFFASNNIALPAATFAALGGFDTSYPLAAGEDRDFCDRWQHAGHPLAVADDAVVDHAHVLDARGFWRQHLGYGRGAHRYHQLRAARAGAPPQVEPARFYLDLVAHPLREPGGRDGLAIAALIGVAQVANVIGYAAERRRGG